MYVRRESEEEEVFNEGASDSDQNEMVTANQKKSKPSKGRWTRREQVLFEEGLRKYGKEWRVIADMIKTRTVIQIRTHAQKYFQKLAKTKGGPVMSTSKKEKLIGSLIGLPEEHHLTAHQPNQQNFQTGALDETIYAKLDQVRASNERKHKQMAPSDRQRKKMKPTSRSSRRDSRVSFALPIQGIDVPPIDLEMIKNRYLDLPDGAITPRGFAAAEILAALDRNF